MRWRGAGLGQPEGDLVMTALAEQCAVVHPGRRHGVMGLHRVAPPCSNPPATGTPERVWVAGRRCGSAGELWAARHRSRFRGSTHSGDFWRVVRWCGGRLFGGVTTRGHTGCCAAPSTASDVPISPGSSRFRDLQVLRPQIPVPPGAPARTRGRYAEVQTVGLEPGGEAAPAVEATSGSPTSS